MKKVNIGVWNSILKVLGNSWEKIYFDYSNLSKPEKRLITKKEFDHLVEEIQTYREELKNGVKYN